MEDAQGLRTGSDGKDRCWWCGTDELYQKYHDEEWGRPVRDDDRLFENICLEGFQSGLSWLTILRKRPAFRAAFHDFDIDKIAQFDDRDVERLLQDAGIVRHRGKINATINNARRARELRKESTLTDYFWSFQPASRTISHRAQIPAQIPESQALARDLKRRGWLFVGPTTCYAFMQAMGMVNDHLESCWVHPRGHL
jgi:DNA-3-methyladenine glycosylase I